MRPLLLVGWKERVALPQFGIDVDAKMDSGALSSALHAHELVIGRRRRHQIARFRLPGMDQPVELRVVGWRDVTDSGGHTTNRPVVRLRVVLGTASWTETLTLADRSELTHPLLLGRRALRRGYVVDASRTYLQGPPVRAAANAARAP